MYQFIIGSRQLRKLMLSEQFHHWFDNSYVLSDFDLNQVAHEVFIDEGEQLDSISCNNAEAIEIAFGSLESFSLTITYPKLPKDKDIQHLTKINKKHHFEFLYRCDWMSPILFAGVTDVLPLQRYIESNWFEKEYNLTDARNYFLIEASFDVSRLSLWHGSNFDDDNHIYLMIKEKYLINEITAHLKAIKIPYQLNHNELSYYKKI